jgi:hypothetical protein
VIRENNRPNTCLEPGDDVCGVPPRTGILVMAADENLVRNNTVTGNDSYGIAVANICLAQELPEEVCEVLRHRAEPGRQHDRPQHRHRQRHEPRPQPAASLRGRPGLGRQRRRQLLGEESLRNLVPGPAAGLLRLAASSPSRQALPQVLKPYRAAVSSVLLKGFVSLVSMLLGFWVASSIAFSVSL